MGKIILFQQEAYKPDDGTRVVKILGCEYKLLESEILDWLGLFGDVITEISEEPCIITNLPTINC